MATTSEKQALAFLLLLALLGAGVQAVGVSRFDREAAAAGGSVGTDAGAAALGRQLAAVDSARAAGQRGRGRGRGRRVANGAGDSSSSRNDARNASRGASRARNAEKPPEPEFIDVNAASAAELERLPRVGPALAQRMVAWRERHGPFSGPDDLHHVRGIGPSTVRLLLPRVTFSGRHSPLLSEGPPTPAPFADDVV